MHTKLLLSVAIAVATLAAAPGLANAQTAQGGTPAIAAAGSPLIVPGAYLIGTVTRWDALAGVIAINGVDYPVSRNSRVDRDITVGHIVDVTSVTEHYGRAARNVAIRVRLAERGEDRAP